MCPLTSRIASTWGCSQTELLCTTWLMWKVSGTSPVWHYVHCHCDIQEQNFYCIFKCRINNASLLEKNKRLTFPKQFLQLSNTNLKCFKPEQAHFCQDILLCQIMLVHSFWKITRKLVYFKQENTTWRMDIQSSFNSSCCGKETWRVYSRQLLRGENWQTSW